MQPSILLIDEDAIERYETLEESDLDSYAVMVNGAIVTIEIDEEDAEARIEALNDEPEDIGMLGFGAETQCDDGDDPLDEDGGVWGEGLFDNTVGKGEWEAQNRSEDYIFEGR